MSESASFEDLLNEFYQTSPQAQKGEPVMGDKVSGILIAIGEEFALVDLGAKSEGRLDLAAIRDAEGQLKYAVGDTVETHVTGKDKESGMLLLGSQHGHKYHGIDELERAYRQGLPVQGQVTGAVKGGCEVQVAGIRAFCPASQIDSRFEEIEDLSEFVGQKLDFRITKFEGGRRPNLVVSRRALLEEEPHAQIKEGTVLTGKEVLQVGQQVEASTNYKTIAEVKQLDARARIKYLKACWAMTRPRIIGRLERAGGFWWLRDVTDTEGFPLEYPLSDVPKGATVEHGGVFIANDTSEAAKHLRPDRYAVAQFDLAFEKEQQKKGNPLLIRVLPQSIDVLREIPADRIPWRADSSIALEESVFQAYFEEICEASASQIQSLKQEIGELESQRADIATDLHVRMREREDAENACDVALRARAEIESIHQCLAQEVEDSFAARREQLERETLEHQAALQQRYEDEERALRAEMDAIAEELAAARKQRDRELGEIRSQTDALLYYVKSQIEPLHRLELITDAQWDALFPVAGNARDQTREDWPLFDGKTTQAIDHIQRYLFSKGIGYPWDLLANFHALLCTGDLIILSGLSGSGKTNLVKSYADATGNEARIVPVKPNWTSAEDLLGFHNPLQRAYATTPFLEALFEASRDPERLYIICLDEMNLARVEYYFADFLSRLEDRADPSIELYPDNEAGHVLTELRVLMQTLTGMKLDLPSVNLETLLADGCAMTQLAERLGLGDGESFAQLHARIRRMLSGVLTVPARLQIPTNVRFVGAINMDDTTHYLSPKVLDRAHVLQFQNPLDYWQLVLKQVGEEDRPTLGMRIPAGAFPPRDEYPPYREEDPLVAKLTEYGQSFLAPLGIELGMRPLRQAIHYRDRLADVFEGEGLDLLALNNLLRQKVFPRFSFDGKQSARGRGEQIRDEVTRQFRDRLVGDLAGLTSPDGALSFRASDELAAMIEQAKANDGVYNYWA